MKPRIKNAKLIQVTQEGSYLKSTIFVECLDEEDAEAVKDFGKADAKVGDSLTLNINLEKTDLWNVENIHEFFTNRAEWVMGKLSDQDSFCMVSDFLVEIFESIDDARITPSEEKASDV